MFLNPEELHSSTGNDPVKMHGWHPLLLTQETFKKNRRLPATPRESFLLTKFHIFHIGYSTWKIIIQ
jgi:hypothetical protein